MKATRTNALIDILLICLSCFLLNSCNRKQIRPGILVATESPCNLSAGKFIWDESERYLSGLRIVSFDIEKQGSYKILTENFYSAGFPDISFDGKYMLFSAQQKEGDVWQIWEMDLGRLSCTKVTSSGENCTDPAYLPDGRILFSKLTVNDTVKSAHCLYTCNRDGSAVRQITFSPASSFATTVLRDGRLLTMNRQLIPGITEPVLTVMRPDGTKSDEFYRSTEGSILKAGPCETSDGKILFIESGIHNNAGFVSSIDYNMPLHSMIDLSSGISGDFCYVFPIKPDQYLVSFKKSDSDPYSVFYFDPVKKLLGQEVFSDPEFDILDITSAGIKEIPRKLPSEVDLQVKTGLLMCQNINLPAPETADKSDNRTRADRIEVFGVDTTYGIVWVEDDGSFYLKVMADTPFRIRTLDEKGNTVNGPCSWLWLRPNERRGCIGCHENPELAPDNRVSLAVRKSPVIIPVHITEIKEKIVDLE